MATAAAACCDARYSSSSAQHHAWVWQLCGWAICVILGEVCSENPTAWDGQDFDLLEQGEGEEAVKFGAFLPADQLSGFYWG